MNTRPNGSFFEQLLEVSIKNAQTTCKPDPCLVLNDQSIDLIKRLAERRIATDLHSYYGEIEYKIKACLKLHVSYI